MTAVHLVAFPVFVLIGICAVVLGVQVIGSRERQKAQQSKISKRQHEKQRVELFGPD